MKKSKALCRDGPQLYDKAEQTCSCKGSDEGQKETSEASVGFKVEAKRGNKNFPIQSPEICRQLGGYLLKNVPGLKVDVHDPDFIFYVEVRDSTYIYCDIIPAFGGLPVGTSGKAMLLLSGGIDSPVAGWMMAKKRNGAGGCSFPYLPLYQRACEG